jgi:hypothetical protein
VKSAHEEKEVRVYYKFINDEFALLTVKVRYESDFSQDKGRNQHLRFGFFGFVKEEFRRF